MIFHEHKAIFLHVGKTAGSAIENFFAPAQRDPSITDHKNLFGLDYHRKIYLQHATLETVRSIAPPRIYKKYFKFSFVRNPFERAVSVFNYNIHFFQEKLASFREFVLHLPFRCPIETARGGGHTCRQVDYVFDENGEQIDFVGKFEDLDLELARLATCLGLKDSIVLPPPPNRYPYIGTASLADFDDQTIRVIQNVYRKDFERFEYSTSLPE